MPSIFIAGIPKGLDQRIVSLRIKKDIETVAQVKTIEIQKEKGYGFVSLLDETSADFVLSLNKKICINGNPLRIKRWKIKSGLPKTPRRTTFPLCKGQVNNDVFVVRGYDTYTNYKRHRPQTDVLYQYIQQSPKQKQVKRKPWKDNTRLSQLPSPKSRKSVRTKKRKRKKTTTRCKNIKPPTPSSKVGLHFAPDGQRRTKYFCSAPEDDSANIPRSSKNVTRTKNVISTEMISENTLSSIHSQSSARVHVYDHSKRVCSIEIDSNNVLQNIRTGLKNALKLPDDDTVLISHNGKTVNSQWQPKIENDDNIHIVVKGKGGMMQGDPPDKNDGSDGKKTAKDNCTNETTGSDATGYSTHKAAKNIEEKTESRNAEETVDNGIQNTTGSVSAEDGSDGTTSTADESTGTAEEVTDTGSTLDESSVEKSLNTNEQWIKSRPGDITEDKNGGNEITNKTSTGSVVDESLCTSSDVKVATGTGCLEGESPDTSSHEDEFSGTGSREDESSGTGSSEDESSGTGSGEDESTSTGSREDEYTGTGSRGDESTGTGSREEKYSCKVSREEKYTGTGSREDESSGTGSREEEASGTGSREDESPGTGSREDESSGTGSREEEHTGTGSHEDKSSGTGSREDESSGTGSREDESPGTGSREDESSGTGSREDESTGTGSREDESTGTGSREDESSGTRSREDESSGTRSREEEHTGTGSHEDECSGTGSREDESSGTGSREDELSGTGSRHDQERLDQKHWNEHIQKNKMLLQQVEKSSPFDSTFFQGSEVDQARLIHELDLCNYFPDQLTYQSVMCIRDTEKDEADTLADIPRLILRKLIMLDFTSREHYLNRCLKAITAKEQKPFSDNQKDDSTEGNDDYTSLFDDVEDTNDESTLALDSYNPVDIFLSIFICLHPTLKQKVCLKMFTCHLAIPIIFPVKKNENQEKMLLFSISPLRSITVHDGKTDTSLINCKQNIVSFVRLGRPQISKSKLANEILFETTHNAFFNSECLLGSCKKQASAGLVEGSWFVPTTRQQQQQQQQQRKLQSVTLFLNLRGDASNNAEQMAYLKSVSDIMVVVIDKESLRNRTQLESFKQGHFNVVFLLTGKVTTDFIRKYKPVYMKGVPKGFNAEFIQGSVHGQNIGLSEIKERLLDVIEALMKGTTPDRNIHDLCEQARGVGITIDEDMPSCESQRKLANTIFDEIEKCRLVDVKLTFTPLQTEHWKKFTESMKLLHKTGSDLKEKEELNYKMKLQRKQQWKIYKKGKPLIKNFVEIISQLDDDCLVTFLEFLKFELDGNSKKKMPYYRKKYAEAWDEFKTNSSFQNQQIISKAEAELSEASFGIEHIFRELGQICEASLMENESKLGAKLAKAVARSITLGYPFELMDGDVANVSVKWVERIFKELEHMLGNCRVLTLSILGLQGSGKSTLLNAMFGLTFPVSAGRCTRGIYVHFCPVEKGKFKFDYVLVVDTEGLRAPELGEQKYQHDNELATLVLGMADITVVNIKGENTSEVKDILQICVHAFLRLKMANQNLQLRQSCIFIHQNVSDVGAKDSMIHARKKLDETLDRMATEAAVEESISNVKCFKNVINFDSNHHVWYFNDLWKGDPPMAPANPGYSRKVQEVKSFIIKSLTQHKHSYLSISETFTHINDLWNGILANDFVFSFRNTVELKAYSALESEYQNLIWELERFMETLTNKAEVKMNEHAAKCEKQKENSGEMAKFPNNLHKEYLDDFQSTQSNLKTKLKNYFEESDKRDEIAKWKGRKLLSWDVSANEYRSKLKTQLLNIESKCKIDYEMIVSEERLTKQIYKQAKDLAEQIKGSKPSKKDMEKTFNDMWMKWISNLDIQEEASIEIKELLESILDEIFKDHRELLEDERKKNTLVECKTFKKLVNSLDDFKFDGNFVSIKHLFSKVKGYVQERFAGTNETTDEVVFITNLILKSIDTRLEDLNKKEWKFNHYDMKNILRKCILQQTDQHNNDKKKHFTFLARFKVKLSVHVFRMALPLLERKDKEYRENHGIKAKLNKHKTKVWSHFQDVVEEKTVALIACDRLCEIIRDKVEQKVKDKIPDLIYEDIVKEFEIKKHVLIADVLEDLANKHNLNLYLQYIHNSYSYTFEWLTAFINNKCFGDSDKLYKDKTSAALYAHFKVITKSVKENSASCLTDWITNLQNDIKANVWIQTEEFAVVMDQNVTDFEDFNTTVLNKLAEVQTKLQDTFECETEMTVQWSTDKTPYELCMDKLWGCTAECPFCKEPCKWTIKGSHTLHSSIQHRAAGVSGGYWKGANKLLLESCSFNVHANNGFKCSSKCKGDRCKAGAGPEVFHPYRDHNKYIPDWEIAPCPDTSSSKYWAWVLCTFNDDFAKHYNKIKADIPDSWKQYTKEDAIKSLRQC